MREQARCETEVMTPGKAEGLPDLVRQKIEDVHNLPAMPSIVKRVQELCESTALSMNDIGDFLSQEPTLSARVLKAVNSPLYGFPQRISTVRHGLILLGLNFIKGLLISASVGDAMERSIPGLWKHSAGCAAVAKVIARRKGIPDPEEVAAGALLHDMGKMILRLSFPSLYRNCLTRATTEGISLVKAEQDALGVTHAQAARWVGSKWGFPPVLLEQLGCHHDIDSAKDFRVQTAVVNLSDVLIRQRSFGFGGDSSLPELDPAVLQILNIGPTDTENIIAEVENQLCEIEDFLEKN
jgi:HD-like signal output (HDOD) protein